MDGKGVRTLYVDGVVVLQPGWEPPHEGEEEEELREPVVLGKSTLPLRIGSDRDVADRDPFHGYLRELRIWDRARTGEEIRADAFRVLTGKEPGLVALWPFIRDLRDVAGGHDAGLMGNAALAREAPQVKAFPEPPVFEAYRYPEREPFPAWDGRIPTLADDKGITLDGQCLRTEYASAGKLTLEPDRELSMKVVATGEALYLCTNVLLGRPGGSHSAVTLWLDGGSLLRVRLTPDGALEAGSGKGFAAPAPKGIEARFASGERLQAQEDLFPLEDPWWSAEVRIPWAALAPFELGSPLRLAVAYDGEAPTGAGIGLPEKLVERWPALFDGGSPDSWGEASTEAPLKAGGGGRFASKLLSSAPRTPVSSANALASTTPPPNAPTGADFENRCGLLSPLGGVFDMDVKWPLVDPSRPVVQVEGELTKVYVAGEDSEFIHTSHDVDMKVTLSKDTDRFASLFSLTEDGPTISGGPNLVLETESLGFPPHHERDQGARPSVGDHVTVLGRWIFDCGHAAKTEIHPIPLFESDRLEVRPLWPGGPQRTLRMVRVWMNSDPEPWGYEFTGPFTFTVDLPPLGWSPFVRVVEGDPSRVRPTLVGNRMELQVEPPDRTGTFYFEIMVGHLVQPEDFLSRSSTTATMGSWEIEVLDDHDHGFPPDCPSFNLFEDCGELYFAVNVNGVWRQLLWNETLASGMSQAILDSFPVSGPRLNLQVTGYEEDPTIPHGGGEPLSPDPDKDPARDGEGGFDIGQLSQVSGHRVLDAPGGDWRLHFNVSQTGEMPSSLESRSFWEPRLDTEPNDGTPLSLGVLPVPLPNGPPLTTSRDGFLTEPDPAASPASFGDVTLFRPEVDRFRFSLADFADVDIAPLANPLRLDVEQWNPWHHDAPASLKVEIAPGVTEVRPTQDVIGSAGARLKVSSPDGRAGDRPYTVFVETRHRLVPRDWGELLDAFGLLGGRVVDLATVPPDPAADPRLVIDPATQWLPETHSLEMDWAWQHVAADRDYYRIRLPKVAGPPPGHASCAYDSLGGLVVRAHPMTVSVPLLDRQGPGLVVFRDLLSVLPNGGWVAVEISGQAPPRRLYRLEAEWTDSRFYTPVECEQMRQMVLDLRRLTREGELELLKGLIALQGKKLPETRQPWPGPDPAPTELPPLGDFRPLILEGGDFLDLVLSSPEEQPVLARLFDERGVLVGESEELDESSAAVTPSPSGMVPQGRLRVEGLEQGRAYLLQVIPTHGRGDSQEVLLGFGEGPPDNP